jgi:hypothetical protein
MRSHRLPSIVLMAALGGLLLLACAGPASAPGQGGDRPGGLPVGDTAGDGTSGEKPADGQAPDDLPINDSAYIVRTGSLDIEVNDMPATLQQAQGLITGLGGYIAGSKESDDPNQQYASITYRVPVERWFDALTGLRALGTRVVSENTEAADVTADVVDLDARLTNLHAAETQYQGIMARATTIDDVLKVQDALNDVRGQIEQLQAQRDNLANRASLATLTVTWQVPTNATSVATQGWDLGREVDRAFAALVTFTQGLATLAIWLAIAFLPILLPVAVIGLVGYRIIRRRSKRVTMEMQTPAGG